MGPLAEMLSDSPLIVIVPVYNEIDRLVPFVTEWTSAFDRAGIPFEFHCYDDGSTDGSSQHLAALSGADPRVVAHRHENRGHGPTVARGYREHASAPWLLQVDADDVIGPAWIVRWWPDREQYDLLMMVRRDGGRSAFRRGLSQLARHSVRVLFGRGLVDVNAPYRLVRNAACREAYDVCPPDVLLPNVLLSGFACRRGLRVRQDVIEVRGRERRESWRGRLRWVSLAVRGFVQILGPAWRLRRE